MENNYYLDHLDCANCAAKIERILQNHPQVKHAVIDFVNKKLTITTIEEMSEESRLAFITPIITGIEKDVLILSWDAYKKNTSTTNHSCNKDCHCSSHTHAHVHTHHRTSLDLSKLLPLILGTIIGFGSLFLIPSGNLQLIGILLGYLILSYEILLTAIRNIGKGDFFDENFLMTIATIGAFLIGEYPEALAVMILYQIGEFLQDMAVDKSRKHLSDAMNIKPESATILINKELKTVAPEEVSIGDIILVKPSERIPLDGIVIEGSSYVDTSSLTGESVPRKISKEEEVLSGCVNGEGTLSIRVTKSYHDSTVSRILDLVEHATARKSPTEHFITKFARIYTPIVVTIALLLAIIPPIIMGSFDFFPWIYKACGFLVVSCPCALVISVPLGFFGGIGCASRNGIIIKGSNYLEALNSISYAVFDKTGTLTKGTFQVTDIVPSNEIDKDEFLQIAACIERLSTHPIAKSIVNSYHGELPIDAISNYEELAGKGIHAVYKGKEVLLGNSKLLDTFDISYPTLTISNGTVTYLAIDNIYMGYLHITDELKTDSKEAIAELNNLGITTIMLTGDTKKSASFIASELNIDAYYSELLPSDKVEKIEELLSTSSEKKKVVFVGDGINDAPVLARADIGIAMGGVGSDAAVEAADIVIMTDEPSLIKRAITIARFTKKIVTQNIIFALGIKILVMILLTFGLANMWLAIFADVGVAILAIINSIRTLRA